MKKTGFSLLLCLFFLLFLFFPEVTKMGAQEGLSLWYHSVVPILFPFLILSNLMLLHNSFFWILQPFFLLAQYVPSINPWYFHALILGFFCGYPMGAKAIADLIQSKKISSKEGARLLPLVNQANPMFLAGYLGIHILKGKMSFFEILFFLYLPPLVLFLLLCLSSVSIRQKGAFAGTHSPRKSASKSSTYLPEKAFPMEKDSLSSTKKNSMPQSMEHTILSSFSVIVTIGVYMMLFTILSHLLLVVFPHSRPLALVSCFLEFSTGLHRLAQLSFLSVPLKNSLLLALTSFGGFCTAAQTASIIEPTGITMKSYLTGKTALAFLVFLLSYASSFSS